MNIPSGECGPRKTGLKNGARPVRRFWIRASVAAAAATAFGCLYFYIRQFLKDGIWGFDLSLVNKSLGVTALFLIALSMFLTGAAYFSGGPPRPLVFRKYFGLVGFWAGLSHGAVNHLLLPAVGLHPETKAGDLHAEVTGLVALVAFAGMAIASTSWARRRLGGERWRRFLRYAGYMGLVLAAGHTAMLKWGSWAKFFRTFDPVLPSLSLFVAAFAASAVLLRFAVWLAESRKK